MTYLSFKANEAEVQKMEALKNAMHIPNASGVLRALVCHAYDSFFANILPNDRLSTTPFAAPVARAVQGEKQEK